MAKWLWTYCTSHMIRVSSPNPYKLVGGENWLYRVLWPPHSCVRACVIAWLYGCLPVWVPACAVSKTIFLEKNVSFYVYVCIHNQKNFSSENSKENVWHSLIIFIFKTCYIVPSCKIWNNCSAWGSCFWLEANLSCAIYVGKIPHSWFIRSFPLTSFWMDKYEWRFPVFKGVTYSYKKLEF